MCSTLGCGSSSSPSSLRRSMPEQPARLDQRLAPGLLDRGQRLARRRLLGAQGVALGAGLDHHDADVVGHEVVQLARDAGALLGHRLVGAQLVLALEQLGARGERVGAQLAPADGAADEHHREDRSPGEDRAPPTLRRPGRRATTRLATTSTPMPARKRARVGPDGDRVERAQPADALREGRRVAGDEGEHGGGAEHDRAGRERPAAAERDRCGHEEHQQRGHALGPGDRVAEPDLELARHHEAGGHDPVELLALGEALHSADANAARRPFHLPNGGYEAAEDRPFGRARDLPRCPTTSRPCAPTVLAVSPPTTAGGLT